MVNYCPRCGTKKRGAETKFCSKCGYAYQQRNMPMPVKSNPVPTEFSSFDPLRRLSALVANQQSWLRQNTLMKPLQEMIDNIGLRTGMEQATGQQKEMVLAGYQTYTQERVEQVIDEVRQARRLADAEVSTEIKRRDLEVEDIIAEREHQRRLERLQLEHHHEEKVMELRAQLELVNAVIQSFNRLQLIRFEAEAHGIADVQQMKLLTQVIRQSFSALAEIDAGQIEYARRIEEMEFEHLEDASSYQLLSELVQAITDRVTKGVIEFGGQSRTNREISRGS